MPNSASSALSGQALQNPAPDTVAHKNVAIWLFSCAALVFIMVVIGGLTRLTESGLSIVEWRPFTGIIPPLNDADWAALYAKYSQYPEFQKINAWMSVDDFKNIFWLEFIHRLWGRLIGIVFFIPFVWFLAKRSIDGATKWKLWGLFILGGLQGLMGWYMVMSGLVDRPDVSQYRLTAHFGLALVIFIALLWVGLNQYAPRPVGTNGSKRGWQLLCLIVFTALSGGFVAGLDAGYAFNTFPLMDGQLIPDGLYVFDPTWLAPFEDHMTVQWDHRWLAKLTFVLVLLFWWRAGKWDLTPDQRFASHLVLAAACLQVALGISTLLSVVWLPLGVAHQAGAVVLVGTATYAAYKLRRAN
ncbi:COX15/CtaA family protein [Thalassospira lucentensis]|uniref:COX15/CtaA family protein n=1 Tax=Thalassospira lucentensis TaxID=168935 RepID=UPI00399D7507